MQNSREAVVNGVLCFENPDVPGELVEYSKECLTRRLTMAESAIKVQQQQIESLTQHIEHFAKAWTEVSERMRLKY